MLLDPSHPDQRVQIVQKMYRILCFCILRILEIDLLPHQGCQIFASVLSHLLYLMPVKIGWKKLSKTSLRNLLKFCPVQKAIFIFVKLPEGRLHPTLPEMLKNYLLEQSWSSSPSSWFQDMQEEDWYMLTGVIGQMVVTSILLTLPLVLPLLQIFVIEFARNSNIGQMVKSLPHCWPRYFGWFQETFSYCHHYRHDYHLDHHLHYDDHHDPDHLSLLSGDLLGWWPAQHRRPPPGRPAYHDDVWWCMMVYDEVWWSMMMYDDVWWCMMM